MLIPDFKKASLKIYYDSINPKLKKLNRFSKI